uniref:Ribosomal RNA-processing protein 42 n=2 Tax=Ornithodoros turicata TaxID=34597 RepID=A0A2R5LJY9_9ACAR
MTDIQISEAEKTFIIHGIEENFRVDGRNCLEYRYFELETGVVTSCSGSAHVRQANTDILVGVKAELDAPEPTAPKRGRIEFYVDCTANADPEFEGRGGEELGTAISTALTQAYRAPKCLDLDSLCVVAGRQVWVLYVDVLILECGGSLLDAVSVAVKSALYDLRIPKVSVTYDENGVHEVEVSDDPFDVTSLDVSSAPCFVTLSKIGQQFVLDATQGEEVCSVGSLAVAVTETGKIVSLFKGGSGSLHPENIMDTIEVARDIGISLNRAIMEKLELEGTVKEKKTASFLN